MLQMQSAFGAAVLIAFAWAISENRYAVRVKSAGAALIVTLVTAVVLLKVPQIAFAFEGLARGVDAVSAATRAGTSFVFGYIGGGAPPFDVKSPGSDFVLAFQALPIVLVMSVLTTLFFHWRILPPIVRGFSWALERSMGVSGAVGLSTAANIFLGMVEAPLFIKPYLNRLSRGELFMVMTGGMAGIAGTVFVLYATILRDVIPDVAGHMMIAALVGAPAALLISQLMVPVKPEEATDLGKVEIGRVADNTMDAIVRGTAAGVELLISITAMLLVLVALVHLANACLTVLPDLFGAPVTLQRMLGWVMAPVCWLMGIPWSQAVTAGSLMGIKTVLNEFIAYIAFAKLPADALDPRARLIMLYAMCGFANFGSLGIMIGGLSVMAPERRADIISLGAKSILSGTLTTCLMGAIVGVVS
ncbi:nucleoside:proton symporter [Pseudolabrys taiwanensis]|uniref:Nucleoside:proton symporter n=1 Tax=Pseudolabrys taiwanensis TaxID=331696 RepID=A0A345ZR89_9HYPH|nr:nucleoside transporter C-terminal domain-containing protein [Pseudolabrys taiwanensis]AXK79436.1 nucleoside:proton symporter [Pseudolabrys taiwanensis]